MRIGTEYSDPEGDYLYDHLVLHKVEADYNRNYEFKNSKNEKSSDFVDVLVIA